MQRMGKWREQEILERIAKVSGMTDKDLPDLLETAMQASNVYHPRDCLLTALSTIEEEQERWPFMVNIKGAANRSIEAARKVVGNHLKTKFDVRVQWEPLL